MRNIAFLKNWLFPKYCPSEEVGAVQKYLLRKRNFAVDIFILNKSFAKKGSCSEK